MYTDFFFLIIPKFLFAFLSTETFLGFFSGDAD